jgi:regulator of sigma E protease
MITDILSFVVALSILVFVHELGHFLVAKRAGIKVERFSVGYPPKLISFQWGETEYCLSAIPFGGYVKVAGMADVGSDEVTGEPWEFPSKSIWVRMAVIAAGPAMNFLFAFAVFAVLFFAYGMETVISTSIDPGKDTVAASAGLRKWDRVVGVDDNPVTNIHEFEAALNVAAGQGMRVDVDRDGQILSFVLPPSSQERYGLTYLLSSAVGAVVEGTPAEEVGLQEGDRITSVAGVPVRSWDDMREEISSYPDQTVLLTWIRNDRPMETPITPAARSVGDSTVGQIGIRPYTTVQVGLGEAIRMSAGSVYSSSRLILDFIGGIFREDRYKELGGPIRIAMLAGETAKLGLRSFLSFLALLSVNLAVLNLLPIPVLDGGHLTFLTLEAVMRRPLSVRQREFFQQIGLVLILGIMVLVTFNDIQQIVYQRVVDFFQ